MPDLSVETTKAWMSKLPDDVREAMDSVVPTDSEDATERIGKQIEERGPHSVGEVLAANEDAFVKMGRARRIRLYGWVTSRTYPEAAKIWAAITAPLDEGDEGEASGGKGAGDEKGKVAPLLREDIRALAESLSPRVAKIILAQQNIAAVEQASYEAVGEMAMKQG